MFICIITVFFYFYYSLYPHCYFILSSISLLLSLSLETYAAAVLLLTAVLPAHFYFPRGINKGTFKHCNLKKNGQRPSAAFRIKGTDNRWHTSRVYYWTSLFVFSMCICVVLLFFLAVIVFFVFCLCVLQAVLCSLLKLYMYIFF